MGASVSDRWVILVGGYGAFLFDGDEKAAEEMRVHKANWERGIGLKRPATADEVASGSASRCWNHPNFDHGRNYVCRCGDCATLTKQEAP